ncbi:MAG: hypothetical protein K8I00_00040, partial [Candidatus Omnitrophica bacterium]|nr:hypothetical protein [Candidatus Omnitrophota bacterium]
LTSLILSLSLLEIGLAAVGRIYYTPDPVYREDEAEVAASGQAVPAKTLVAVGDSFTHGGLVEGHETYTHFLRQYLSEGQYPNYRVKNLGICELNSGELLKRLPKIIDQNKPYAILLLVGATNRFNPWDYEAFANKGFISAFRQKFFNLRVVKMARFIKLALFARQSAGQPGILDVLSPSARSRETRHDRHAEYIEQWEDLAAQDPDDPLSQAWAAYQQGDTGAAVRQAEKLYQTHQDRGRDLLFSLTYFYLKNDQPEKVQDMIQLVTKNDAGSEQVLDYLAHYRFEVAFWYKQHLQYDRAIDSYLQAIALDPEADYFYYEINKLFDSQSHYTSKMMYDKLKSLAAETPGMSLSKMYQNHLQLYQDRQKWEAGIEEWVRHDLDHMAALCRKKGVKLIIQKYPVSYPMANKVLEETARKYSLPVVDHLSRFEALEPKNKYFFDDDHCTRIGHQIMAANIMDTLVKSEIITHEQRH